MKKFVLLCLLALPWLALSEERASAWCSFKFGVGFNLEYTSSGNCWLWGLYKSGPCPPGCCLPPLGCGLSSGSGVPYLATGPAEGNALAGFPVAPWLGGGDHHLVNYPGYDPGYSHPVSYPGYDGGYYPVGYYGYGQ
jgi:hypothetical protein